MILLLHGCIYGTSCLVKKYMNRCSMEVLFKKKLLKKQCVYRNKKLSVVLLLFSDINIQTNHLFIFINL